MVLPNLDRMRESADVLAHSAEFNDHLFAARDLLNDLCTSIKMFSAISLPHLLGPNKPLRPSEDLVWLSNTGYHLDEVLRRKRIYWPPPEQRDPPAIVRDLMDMYEKMASRHEYFSSVTAATLLEVVKPVGFKACELTASRSKLENLTRKKRNRENRATSMKGSSMSRLTTILGIAALGITFLQGPAAVNDLPESWNTFSHGVEHLVQVAGNGAVDYATEVGVALDQH
jgi:hypothetical protein